MVDYVGQTEANAWGLNDMVGNVSEWTRSSYRPYPYRDDDGRNDDAGPERKVARGGSWADRPADAGSSVRRAYEPWQKVYDVGFRVIVEDVNVRRTEFPVRVNPEGEPRHSASSLPQHRWTLPRPPRERRIAVRCSPEDRRLGRQPASYKGLVRKGHYA